MLSLLNKDELIREMISTIKPLFLNERKPDSSMRLLNLMQVCFRNLSMAQLFTYFIKNGTATTWLLQFYLALPEKNIVRNLRHLRTLNIVELVIKIPQMMGSRGGPIPSMWGLVDNYTRQNIADTVNLHYRSKSPKYRLAEQLAQTILEEAERNNLKEIRHTSIMFQIRSTQMPFNVAEIIQLTTQYLHDQGIKILYT